MADVTVTLSKPLKTHDGDKTELTLREPTAGLMFEAGQPYHVEVVGSGENAASQIIFKDAIMKKWISKMTGIDDILLERLSIRDYMKVRSAVLDLIFGAVGANPSNA